MRKPDIRPHRRRIDAVRSRLGDVPYVSAVTDGDAVTSAVFDRGNHRKPSGVPVPHRFLTALDPAGEPFTSTPSGRLDLAGRIADPGNPLTARVMVNRLWRHAFGRGIVATVDNFGAQGSPASHWKLLDYLALRFVERGWSIKAALREILLSETFRRSTRPSAAARHADPRNLLLSHYPVRRLEAEAIRDALLSVSGRLDTTMYGEPVPVHLTRFLGGPGRPEVSGPLDGDGRRSVYLEVRRNFLSPIMLTFDRPAPFSTFGARNVTNVPGQSLTLLNDPLVAQQAAHWADSLLSLARQDVPCTIRHLYLKALAREPTDIELSAAASFLEAETERTADARSAWASLCHVIFNLKEFIYLM